jgi:carbon starvation protein
LRRIGTNMYVATIVTVGASLALLLYGYKNIWPIFGSTNQLLAALALLAVTAWFSRRGKKCLATAIPMVIMFAITLAALGLLAHGYLLGEKPNALLGAVALLLLGLAIVLIAEAVRAFRRPVGG